MSQTSTDIKRWQTEGTCQSRKAAILRRVQALALLVGSVRPNALTAATGRSLLDLPIGSGCSILGLWYREAARLARLLQKDPLPLRVRLDRGSPKPKGERRDGRLATRLERDPVEYRGTAGVLRDLAEEYRDGDYLLVATGAQVLLSPLEQLAVELAETEADLSLVAHEDGTPSGLMLVKCSCLRSAVPAIGYMDMKEQALPRIAERHRVRVVRRNRPTALPVRGPTDYITALIEYTQRRGGQHSDPFDERWQATFSITEQGAIVEQGALLHDSVVLSGGHVERRAAVVRSVVCSTGVVRSNRTVINETVAARGTRPWRGDARGAR